MSDHLYVPDTQVKPGIPADHLIWLSKLIMDLRPDKIIWAGDWWDFPSLSSYDRGKKSFEGRRFKKDIEAGNEGWEIVHAEIDKHNKRKAKNKKAQYRPKEFFTEGNHEDRVRKAIEMDASLEGVLVGPDELIKERAEFIPFMENVFVDGVAYSHFFYAKNSGRPHPSARAVLQREHMSCTQGHTQGLDIERMYNAKGKGIIAVRAGSFYLHDEVYKGPSGNHHWRGVIYKKNVTDGEYDLREISTHTLRKEYGNGAARFNHFIEG